MTDITEFLRARLDELGQNAPDIHDRSEDAYLDGDCVCGHPARVLAQVAAMRAIVDLHTPGGGHECSETGNHFTYIPENENCETLRHLAAIWRDHEAYDPAWAPDVSST